MNFPAIVLLPAMLLGCATATKPAADPEAGFVSLFNGNNLDGWIYGTDRAGNERKSGNGYQVRDGAILCTRTDNGNLYTAREYCDFILRFEFKLTPDANNGIAIRAPRAGQATTVGIEIQVLDDTAAKHASLRPAQYHGSIYSAVAAQRGHLKPVGEWNNQEIIADGRRITVKLNGATIVDADLDEITDPAILKKNPGLQRRCGRIGFIGHSSAVEFRNIRIKELN
jgi:hypothetical protein